MKIVAVIPGYNEAKRIGTVIKETLPYVQAVIVVNDGSTDDTAEVSRKAGAIVVSHIENCGAGAATMTGIEAARLSGASTVITLDADGQHNPEDIPAMLLPIQDGSADVVFANRFGQRNKIPLIRRIFNWVGNLVTLLATGRWVADSQCGFRVFGKHALSQVDLRMSGFEFASEIVRESVQHKWRIVQVPAKVLYSEYTLAKGQSFASGIRTAFKILLRSFLR